MIVTERGRQRLPEHDHPESLMSPPMHPAPGALPKCDFFTADSAGARPGRRADMHRRTPPSVINWQGGVLVMAGHCHEVLASVQDSEDKEDRQ